MCSDPNVYLVHHFLSAGELEHLDGLITDRRGAFKQSVTDDATAGASAHVVESQERTSASLHLPKGGDTSLRAIEARAAEQEARRAAVGVERRIVRRQHERLRP